MNQSVIMDELPKTENEFNAPKEYAEMHEFIKFEDPIDFSLLESAFEESTIYTAHIENTPERTTYVAQIDEHDESAGYNTKLHYVYR